MPRSRKKFVAQCQNNSQTGRYGEMDITQFLDVTQEANRDEKEGNMAAFNLCFSANIHKIYLKKILVTAIYVKILT